jgi:hypothetical protein
MINDNFSDRKLGYDIMLGTHRSTDINRGRTMCCALGQLSLNNDNTLQEIQLVIDDMKKEIINGDATRRNGGEKAVFVITLPIEIKLEKTLEAFGFKFIYEFHRRDCYPQDELLKMWIYSWE